MTRDQRDLLDRANLAAWAGDRDDAEQLMAELLDDLNPEPFGVPVPPSFLDRLRASLVRAWHRLTCRAPACLELYGQFQHPHPNRRLARR